MKFSNIIVCDDIRREVGGKYTLVGTYLDRVVFDNKITFPHTKQLGFYLRLEREEADPEINGFLGEIFFDSPSELEPKRIAKINGRISGDFTKGVLIDLVIPLNLPNVGELKLKFKALNNGAQIAELTQNLIKIDTQEDKAPISTQP